MRVERWFDDGMARVSGWYKCRAQVVLLGYSVALVLMLNIDTLTLARTRALVGGPNSLIRRRGNRRTDGF